MSSVTEEEPPKAEKWTVMFSGRKVGAIGFTYTITMLLECPFSRILASLYKEYEHISCVDVRRGHSMNHPESLPQADRVTTDNQVFYRGE